MCIGSTLIMTITHLPPQFRVKSSQSVAWASRLDHCRWFEWQCCLPGMDHLLIAVEDQEALPLVKQFPRKNRLREKPRRQRRHCYRDPLHLMRGDTPHCGTKEESSLQAPVAPVVRLQQGVNPVEMYPLNHSTHLEEHSGWHFQVNNSPWPSPVQSGVSHNFLSPYVIDRVIPQIQLGWLPPSP